MNESGWGGKRSGAGRPKGTTKEVSNQRPQHKVRAFDDEWEIIKAFAALVKKDKEKAIELMEMIILIMVEKLNQLNYILMMAI